MNAWSLNPPFTHLGYQSQDPLGFVAGDANLYRYVGNSPTNATDPTGLIEVDDNPNNAKIKALPNVLDKIEKIINDTIVEVHKQFPDKPEEGIKGVYEALGKLEGLVNSKIETKLKAELQEGTERYTIPFDESRFNNVKFFVYKEGQQKDYNDIPAAFQAQERRLGAHNIYINQVKASFLAPVVNIGASKVPVGTDKFGHFFEEGYLYYKHFRNDPDLTCSFGLFTERPDLVDPKVMDKYGESFQGFFGSIIPPFVKPTFQTGPNTYNFAGAYGWRSSGVASYADLVANEGGFSFYLDLEKNWNQVGKGWTFKLSRSAKVF
jgi:hypothetical protein